MKFKVIILLSAFSLPNIIMAENKQPEVPPPPGLPEDFEEQSSIRADVTIRKGKKKVIEEYRINGQLYMIRVIPKVGKPYYIRYKNAASGGVIRRELDDIDTPFWKLFEW